MSENLGKSLPNSIYSMLRKDNRSRENSVIFILTIDSKGYPHVAMLSPYQVCAADDSSFVFSIYTTSSSCNNLKGDGRSTLIIQADEGVYYIKSKTSPLDPNPENRINGHTIFRSSDLSIAFDHSEKAPIVSETRFLDSGIKERYTAEYMALARIASNYLSGE